MVRERPGSLDCTLHLKALGNMVLKSFKQLYNKIEGEFWILFNEANAKQNIFKLICGWVGIKRYFEECAVDLLDNATGGTAGSMIFSII